MSDKRNVTMIAIVVLLTYLTWKYFSSSSSSFLLYFSSYCTPEEKED